MAKIDINEINLTNESSDIQHSTPYEEYFGEMEIPEDEKRERINMANDLEGEILFILSLLAVTAQFGYVNVQNISHQLNDRYVDVVQKYMSVDDYMKDYIHLFSLGTVAATMRHIDDAYYTSLDRAMYISENETNTSMNYRQFTRAIAAGKTRKTWLDVRDKRERKTHLRVGGKTIKIQEPFMVGNSFMMFPKDTSFDAEAKEIVNCRCSINYS